MDKFYLKSQTAMEFIILAGFLLFFFIAVLGVASSNAYDLNRERAIIIGEDLATKVQKEINLAARVVDGYSREFTLPAKLGQKEYNISIIGNEVIITSGQNDFWRVIPPVIGNITQGRNTINKTNGIIYIYQ